MLILSLISQSIILNFLWIHFFRFQTSAVSVNPTRERPHIVIILADDLGHADVGYRGVSKLMTPNIDKLASEGVKLENYYVQPLCSPTRSQLLSGRYQIHTGLQHDLISPCQKNSLPQQIPTLPSLLKQLNYSTHMVGKWHLGLYSKQVWPQAFGFDSFFGYMTGDEDYYTHIDCYNFKNNHPGLDSQGTSYTDLPRNFKLDQAQSFNNGSNNTNTDNLRTTLMCGRDFRDGFKLVSDKYEGQYSTHVFVERAEEIIRGHALQFGPINKGHPLFLYLPFQAVHAPLQVPKRYQEPFQFIKDKNRRSYAGMAYCLDEAVGNITQALKDHNMWDNTILIFSTDNGGQILYGGYNFPLRGWKASLWEGGIKAVGFIRGPGIMSAVKSRELIHVTDWLPTLVRLAGGHPPAPLDGYDVGPVLISGLPSPRHEILHNIDPLTQPRGKRSNDSSPFDNRVMAAIRYKNWKLITGNPGNGSWIALPEDEGKTNSTLDPDPEEKNIWLFDLESDPIEFHDLSQERPDIVAYLLERLMYYNETSVNPRYPPDNPMCDPEFNGGAWGPWDK